MKIFLFCILILAGTISFGQDFSKPYTKENYPSKDFKIENQSFKFKRFTLKFISVKSKTDTLTGSKVFVNIYSKKKLIDQKELGSEWLKGVYGLPEVQPLENYFMVINYGNWNGNFYLIDSTGILRSFPGYYWAVSPDKKFLCTKGNNPKAETTVSKFVTENGMLIQKKIVFKISGEPWSEVNPDEYKGMELKLFKE